MKQMYHPTRMASMIDKMYSNHKNFNCMLRTRLAHAQGLLNGDCYIRYSIILYTAWSSLTVLHSVSQHRVSYSTRKINSQNLQLAKRETSTWNISQAARYDAVIKIKTLAMHNGHCALHADILIQKDICQQNFAQCRILRLCFISMQFWGFICSGTQGH